MSDEVENVEVEKPKQGDPNAEAAKYRKQAKQYKDKVAQLEGQLFTLQTSYDELVSRPDESAQKIAELEHTIRLRSHKDVFAKLAQDKIKAEALDDAFALSGWSVDSDEVDEEKLGTVIDNLIKSKTYLRVDESAVPGPEGNSDSPVANRSFSLMPSPAKGSGRGQHPDKSVQTNKRLSL